MSIRNINVFLPTLHPIRQYSHNYRHENLKFRHRNQFQAWIQSVAIAIKLIYLEDRSNMFIRKSGNHLYSTITKKTTICILMVNTTWGSRQLAGVPQVHGSPSKLQFPVSRKNFTASPSSVRRGLSTHIKCWQIMAPLQRDNTNYRITGRLCVHSGATV